MRIIGLMNIFFEFMPVVSSQPGTGSNPELSFLVYIYIKGIDSMGLLNEVTQVISRQLNVNIRKLTIETNDGIFEGKIQLWVHDVEDVKTICNNLKKIQNIKQVNRVEE